MNQRAEIRFDIINKVDLLARVGPLVLVGFAEPFCLHSQRQRYRQRQTRVPATLGLFCDGFNYASVQFFSLVVVDSYQKNVACVLFYLAHIFLAFYLIDGGIYFLLVFEFENDSRFFNIPAWNKNEVCKALACSEFFN